MEVDAEAEYRSQRYTGRAGNIEWIMRTERDVTAELIGMRLGTSPKRVYEALRNVGAHDLEETLKARGPRGQTYNCGSRTCKACNHRAIDRAKGRA